MTTREQALEAALREARGFIEIAAFWEKRVGNGTITAKNVLADLDAALALPASDLPARLVEGLRAFADVGRAIEGHFGPAIWRDDEDAFQDGCSWLENGERRALSWVQFRRAAALVKEAEAAGYTGGKDD